MKINEAQKYQKAFCKLYNTLYIIMVIIAIVNHLPPHSRKPIYSSPLNLSDTLCNSPQANKATERYHELSLREDKGDGTSGKKFLWYC